MVGCSWIPKPELPNPDAVRYKEILSPIVAPFDMKGVGELSVRYLSASRQDDTWLYVPAVRRVRRMSTAQRSDSLFGQDTDQDSYWGFSGHIAWSDWKLIGVKEELGVVHREHYRVQRCPGGADFTFCDNWEKRKVYVIEGTSRLPQYAYGKRILYIDAEAWVVLHSDIYDKRGELWKVWLEYFTFRKQSDPASKIVYDDEMGFTSAVMIDTQMQHATRHHDPRPGLAGPGNVVLQQGCRLGVSVCVRQRRECLHGAASDQCRTLTSRPPPRAPPIGPAATPRRDSAGPSRPGPRVQLPVRRLC